MSRDIRREYERLAGRGLPLPVQKMRARGRFPWELGLLLVILGLVAGAAWVAGTIQVYPGERLLCNPGTRQAQVFLGPGEYWCAGSYQRVPEGADFEATGQGYLSDGQRVEVRGLLHYLPPSDFEQREALWSEWGSQTSFEEIELALTFAEQVRRVFLYYSPSDLSSKVGRERLEELLKLRMNECLQKWQVEIQYLRLSYPDLSLLQEPTSQPRPERPIQIAI